MKMDYFNFNREIHGFTMHNKSFYFIHINIIGGCQK